MVWYGGLETVIRLEVLYCYVGRRSPALSLPRPRALKPAGLTEVGRRTFGLLDITICGDS